MQISNLLLNKETQIIKITKLDDKKSAMEYFNALANHEKWLNFKAGKKIETVVITNPNLINLLQEKELAEYKEYFSEKYLNY